MKPLVYGMFVLGVLLGAPVLVAQETVLPITEEGWFQLENTTDPFTGKARVVVAKSSEEGGSLMLRCDDDDIAVFVTWDDFLGLSDERSRVLLKWGQEEPTSESWNRSTSGTATFARNEEDFLRKLRLSAVRKDTLLMRTTPYNSGPITLSFALSGGESFVDRVWSACNDDE